MKKPRQKPRSSAPTSSELLLLPDGRIIVHNLTPALADLLEIMNPGAQLASRFPFHASRITHHVASVAPHPHELPD